MLSLDGGFYHEDRLLFWGSMSLLGLVLQVLFGIPGVNPASGSGTMNQKAGEPIL